MSNDLITRLREETECYRGKTQSCLTEAVKRIEQLETQVDRLRAAMYDMTTYLSRADYYYMEPETLEVLREINGG